MPLVHFITSAATQFALAKSCIIELERKYTNANFVSIDGEKLNIGNSLIPPK